MDFSIGSKRESSSAATICCAGELDVSSCRKLIDAIEKIYAPELDGCGSISAGDVHRFHRHRLSDPR